jgi:galactan beta-1,4-galactosyltransferase
VFLCYHDREWIVYHVKLFGKRAHFVIYDAGGVHPTVMDVLRPWVEIGAVTLHDVRDQERFDGYTNSSMILSDSKLLSPKTLAVLGINKELCNC